MQDAWYADNRDLVKWGVLVHLAAEHRLSLIIQVGFLRSAQRPKLSIDGLEHPLPAAVWEHFRNPMLIQALGERLGVRFLVVDQPFSHLSRRAYMESLTSRLRREIAGKVVLLDPDTGIEPRSPNAQHVTSAEVTAVWEALAPEDVLVLYQHAYRDRDWCVQTRTKFLRACRGGIVTTATARSVAADVAFHIATKATSSPRAAQSRDSVDGGTDTELGPRD